jgi:hypothetical protein
MFDRVFISNRYAATHPRLPDVFGPTTIQDLRTESVVPQSRLQSAADQQWRKRFAGLRFIEIKGRRIDTSKGAMAAAARTLDDARRCIGRGRRPGNYDDA